MTTSEIARSQGMSPVRSAVHRSVRLLIFGLIGWLGFVSAADFVWRAVSLAAVLALAAIVGVTWYLTYTRATGATRRFNAALDAYAAQEIARTERLKEIARAQRSKAKRAHRGLPVAPADDLHHGGTHARTHTEGRPEYRHR
jgi:hypothetical protein